MASKLIEVLPVKIEGEVKHEVTLHDHKPVLIHTFYKRSKGGGRRCIWNGYSPLTKYNAAILCEAIKQDIERNGLCLKDSG